MNLFDCFILYLSCKKKIKKEWKTNLTGITDVFFLRDQSFINPIYDSLFVNINKGIRYNNNNKQT